MFDIGGGELILIVLAILVLFGPEKIPEIAQMFGKGMQQLRKAQSQFQTQINDIQKEVNKSIDLNDKAVKPAPIVTTPKENALPTLVSEIDDVYKNANPTDPETKDFEITESKVIVPDANHKKSDLNISPTESPDSHV